MKELKSFLDRITLKIGARGAADLSQDAKIAALERLLIDKQFITGAELEKSRVREFETILKVVSNISSQQKTSH